MVGLVLQPLDEEPGKPTPTRETAEPDHAEAIKSPAVDAEEVEELAVPSVGKHYKARITRIVKGRYGDFVDLERLAEILASRDSEFSPDELLARADDPAVMIEYLVEELGVKDTAVYRISFHPKSNYYRLVQQYGKPDPNGRIRLRKGDYVVVKAWQTQSGKLRFRIELDDVAAIRTVLG